MSSFLYISKNSYPKPWRKAIQSFRPDIDFYEYPNLPDDKRHAIDYVLAYHPPAGVLSTLPNLKAVFSLGAGVDGLVDGAVGLEIAHLPILRIMDPQQAKNMRDYVLYQVLHWHRDMHDYAHDRQEFTWKPRFQTAASDRRIGIMGLGKMGRETAETLEFLGFRTMGWSRTKKKIFGVTCFHGTDGLADMLPQTDILICHLPLTAQTHGILNASLFSQLPGGSVVINVGRGPHLVETDLLDALDANHLRGASLDCFNEEPLPTDHPFWTHPKIAMTPHIAATSNAKRMAPVMFKQIEALETGKKLKNLVDPARGY